MSFSNLIARFTQGNLVIQILVGLLAGILTALIAPPLAENVGILGKFFISTLKAVAPILVFVLIMSAIAQQRMTAKANIHPIIIMYIVATFFSALIAVIASTLFPVTLTLSGNEAPQSAPSSIGEVFKTLLFNISANPVSAIANANYMGILSWAVLIGICLRHTSETTKTVVGDFATAITKIVGWVIRLAPFGIFGLVASTIAETGTKELSAYGKLIVVLVGVMLFVALVMNPLIVYWKTRKNPYPLTLQCLTESGITAFFTRSSAANIPVNLNLCKKLGLNPDTYSVSIPLGATINMSGAAITITVLTMAAAHTLGISIDFLTAVLLSALAAGAACGASGVPGGSLLLIPMACGLFGINNDIAAQVITVGMIISVVQDSCETALNSSSDVLFTATAEYSSQNKTTS